MSGVSPKHMLWRLFLGIPHDFFSNDWEHLFGGKLVSFRILQILDKSLSERRMASPRIIVKEAFSLYDY